MHSYRVFVSYSHEDRDLACAVVRALEANGLTPLWDEQMAFGGDFSAQIKTFIAHAHVFLPLITASASARGWVHQEIGYAMALRIPVLPVCRGQFPGEMLQTLHSVRLGDDPTAFGVKLSRAVFDDLINHALSESRPLYECAMLPEDRSLMLAAYADQVRQIPVGGTRAHGRVRQKAALSSFCIPTKRITHPVWQAREGRVPRSSHRRECLQRERQALERHAQVEGCRLILNPWLDYDREYGPGATPARLQTLLEFLEADGPAATKVEVALRPEGKPHSLTILGDWFFAEAVAASLGTGYQQTILTRHAPAVRARLEAFDQEFHELLEEAGVPPSDSKRVAIERLKDQLKKLPPPESR